MVEAMMYAAIGFLSASLLALGIVPLLHARAERLTINELQARLPLAISEVQAERDLLRADFAMQMRRLELKNEALTDKNARQMAALGRDADLITRLQTERDAQKGEIVALRGLRQPAAEQPVQRRRLFKRIAAAKSKSAA
jgi:hypothetical protein